MTVWAIVVAAGSGSRFGGAKQFMELEGRRVVDWAVAACRAVADGGVVLVVPGAHVGDGTFATDVVVAGGATRSASVRAGLDAVPQDADVIVVHDGARPFASPALFDAVVAAVRDGADGAVPGLALADTVKRVAGGRVVETLDRGELVAVQTPQAFAAGALRRAHAAAADATDDAALVEAAGGRVVVVGGDPANTKITVRSDLA
ncbi:MAG TPA: 2-C-methyl-D-erythritol 4-phosphate cytidylyltransferase [Acidimicrobiales bacterium]|nr:2-C-methyl-D-erythritol 4-phosphate cytidylyltransferase [Acidimicrobiales bacterium]